MLIKSILLIQIFQPHSMHRVCSACTSKRLHIRIFTEYSVMVIKVILKTKCLIDYTWFICPACLSLGVFWMVLLPTTDFLMTRCLVYLRPLSKSKRDLYDIDINLIFISQLQTRNTNSLSQVGQHAELYVTNHTMMNTNWKHIMYYKGREYALKLNVELISMYEISRFGHIAWQTEYSILNAHIHKIQKTIFVVSSIA